MQENPSDKNKKLLTYFLYDNILRTSSKNPEDDAPKHIDEILTGCRKSRLQRSLSGKARYSFENGPINHNELVKRPPIEANQRTILWRSYSERPKKTSFQQIILDKDKTMNFEDRPKISFNVESVDNDLEIDNIQNVNLRNAFKATSNDNLDLDSIDDGEIESNIQLFIRNLIDHDSVSNFENYFLDYIDENLLNDGFYQKTLSFRTECEICYDFCLVNERECCSFKSCNNCINLYIQGKIKECCGNLSIECFNDKCKKLMHKDEICERMLKFDENTHNLYLNLLLNANKNSDMKTCPRCSHVLDAKSIENLKQSPQNMSKISKSLTKCQCVKCDLIWCFQCHAPWHEGISCSNYRKGDKMLKFWAKEVHYGQQNAQMCPKCKIFIQRTKGCDHMICSNCNSAFCYSCGKRFRSIKFIGDHYSKLSVLGCKYKLYPDKPLKRKAIRGSILGAKLAATPFVIAAGLVVGVGVLAAGSVALPVYGSYKLYKYSKLKRKTDKPSTLSSKNVNKEKPSVSNFYSNNIDNEPNHVFEFDLDE